RNGGRSSPSETSLLHMADLNDPYTLPADLPVPEDDGAADHLTGAELPHIVLESTHGPVDVAELDVLYVYPRTGTPGKLPFPGCPRLPPAVVRLPGSRRGARGARRSPHRRCVDTDARGANGVRGANPHAVPGDRRSRAPASRPAAPADVRGRGTHALQAPCAGR